MGWVVILIAIILSPNTFFVHYGFSVFSSPYKEVVSAGISAVIVASIVIYTLRRNYKMAKYYCYFEMSISAYYYITTIGFDWGLIPAFGFVLILPISEYYYSREFDSGDEDNEILENQLTIRDLHDCIIEKDQEIGLLKKERSEMIDQYDEAEQQVTEQMQELEACQLSISTLELQVRELTDSQNYYAGEVADRDNQIANMHDVILEQDNRIDEFRKENDKHVTIIQQWKNEFATGNVMAVVEQVKRPSSSIVPDATTVEPAKPKAPKRRVKKK